MQDWQRDIWTACSGVAPKEIKIVTSGRQTGKSTFNQVVQQWGDMLEQQRRPVNTLDREQVDDDTWYMVEVRKDVAQWIRSQNTNSWYEHSHRSHRPMFEVSSQLYTMLNLKW